MNQWFVAGSPDKARVSADRSVHSLSTRIARRCSRPFFGLSSLVFFALLVGSLSFPELGGPGVENVLLATGSVCSLVLYRSDRAQDARGLACYWLVIASLAAAGMLGTGIGSAFAGVCLASTTLAALFLTGRQAVALWTVLLAVFGVGLWGRHSGWLPVFEPNPIGEGIVLGSGALLAAAMAWLLARHAARVEAELAAVRIWEKAVIDNVQEQERKRIAQDLHDELQQTLGVIGMEVGAIRQRPDIDPIELRAMLERTGLMTNAAIESIRRIIHGLRPQILDDLGLAAALEALVAEFEHRSGIQCEFELLGDSVTADPEQWIGQGLANQPQLATCLYRVAQEALSNIHQHAEASFVHVQLEITAGPALQLSVSDNGIGIRAAELDRPESLGVLGMRERLLAFGGQLRVIREAAGGTTVSAQVVLKPSSA